MALLASCASTPLGRQDSAERASYMTHAGKPVDRFTWVTSYRRSAPISSDQILVWTGLTQAYLVTVLHPCANLWFANDVGFTQTGDSVYARLNLVKADGWTCGIKTIQPIDYRGVEQDLSAQR
ncbi:MAG TPA: DUF6491 family protein [Steroidobacteraceae bacterium]|nr:DUF6491 family protein [Steroidobacteraceae bacterium]